MKIPFQTAPVGRDLRRWCHQAARRKAGTFPSGTQCTAPYVPPDAASCNLDNHYACNNDTYGDPPLCCDADRYTSFGGCCKLKGTAKSGALPSDYGLKPGHEVCIPDEDGTTIFCARAT
jgi:hypothetical protein